MNQRGSMYAVVAVLLAAFVWTSYQVKRSEMSKGSQGRFEVSTSTPKRPRLTGNQAPDFTLPSLDGRQVSLADLQGKDVVLLDFSSVSVPMCRAAMPRLAQLEEKYGSKGLKVITVNWGDDPALVKAFAKDIGFKPLILIDDGSAQMQYNVAAMPTIVIVDKTGKVSSVRVGEGGMQYRWIEGEICKLLGLKLAPLPKSQNKEVFHFGRHH